MRCAALILALSLLALPVQAASSSSASAPKPSSSSPVFGQTWCTPAFQCPPSFSTEIIRGMLPSIIGQANSCIANRFAMRQSGGYFEESIGLDANQCLTTKHLPQASTGLTMSPKCCVKPVSNGNGLCQIVCTKYGVR